MLPLLLVGAMALWGGKKAIDGVSASNQAAALREDATIRQKAAEDRLDKTVRQGERAFQKLDTDRADAPALLTGDVAGTLRRVAGVDDHGFTEFKEALARPERLAIAMGVEEGAVVSTAMAAARGLGAGVALSGAAQGAVASFGIASTGASISGLSGAAATNATLAWLGGGSIASGGMGIAGGTAVLGGIVAAPAVLLAGLAYANRAEKQLTDATSYAEDVSVAIEQNKTAERRIAAICRRIREVRKAIGNVTVRTRAAVDTLNAMLDVLPADGRAFGSLPKPAQDRTLLLGVLAGLLSELVEVTIIDEAAQLLDDSSNVLNRVNNLELMEAA